MAQRIPDILQDLNLHRRPDQRLIGFAAQVGDPVPAAAVKLMEKGLDAIVANPIDQPEAGFESEWNRAVILGREEIRQTLPRCKKEIMAHQILDFVAQHLLADSSDRPT